MKRFIYSLIGFHYRNYYCISDNDFEIRKNWNYYAEGHYGTIYKHKIKNLYVELPWENGWLSIYRQNETNSSN